MNRELIRVLALPRSLLPPITRASDTRGARAQPTRGRGSRGASGRSVTGKVDTGIVKGAAGKRANVLPVVWESAPARRTTHVERGVRKEESIQRKGVIY